MNWDEIEHILIKISDPSVKDLLTCLVARMKVLEIDIEKLKTIK